MESLKARETKESRCSWQKSTLTFDCARHKLMTHYVHTGKVRDWADRQASRYNRENGAVLLCWHTYVNAFGRRLPDVMDYLPIRFITVCGKIIIPSVRTIQWQDVTSLFKSPSIFILTVPRRYFCCGSFLLLVLAVRIYTLVQLLC